MPDYNSYGSTFLNTDSSDTTITLPRTEEYSGDAYSVTIDDAGTFITQNTLREIKMNTPRPYDTIESAVVEQAFESFTTSHVHELITNEPFESLVNSLFMDTERAVRTYLDDHGYDVPDAIFGVCDNWNRDLAGWFTIYLDEETASIDVPDDLREYFDNQTEGQTDPMSGDIEFNPDVTDTDSLRTRCLRAYYIVQAMGIDITADQAARVENLSEFIDYVGEHGSVDAALRESAFQSNLHPRTISNVAPPNEWPDHMDPTNMERRTCYACSNHYNRVYTENGNEKFASRGEFVDDVQRPRDIDGLITQRNMEYVCERCVDRVTDAGNGGDRYTIITEDGICLVYVGNGLVYSENGFGQIDQDDIQDVMQNLGNLTQLNVYDRLPDKIFHDNPDIGIPIHDVTVVIHRRRGEISGITDRVYVDGDDFESVQVAKHIIHSNEETIINV